MRLTTLALAFAVLLPGCIIVNATDRTDVAAGAPPAADQLAVQMDTLLAWFPGEWDNHEQHWQQAKVEKVENPIERIHHVFAPVEAPAIGAHTFFVKQYLDGDPSKVYRQRLYAFSRNDARGAIQLDIYAFNDERAFADAHLRPEILKALSLDQVRATKGCEVYWRWNIDHFIGEMEKDACRVNSPRLGRTIVINDTLMLSESELQISDVARDEAGNVIFGRPDGPPHKNRKVRYFTLWGGVKKGGQNAKPDEQSWDFTSGKLIHNEGGVMRIVDDDTGEDSGYSVRLEQLTYQNTKVPILKLVLMDSKNDQQINYIWANPDATNIGMNLGWMQVGLTRKPEAEMARGW